MATKRTPQPGQTPQPTTTTTAPASQSADQYTANNPIPSGGSTTNVGNAPAPIGVGYQINDTGQDIAVFEDGSVQAVQRGEAPSATDETGKPLKFVVIHPGQVVTDTNGVPMPYVAQRTIPGVAGATSRISPGSPGAAAAAQEGVTQQVPAQYREGDEYRIAGNLPPEQRAQIQQAMLDRGLFGSAKPRTALGGWDAESAAAFKQLLAYANSTGQDYNTALENMPKLTDEQLNGKSAVISLSHPDDLAAVFKNAAANLIGSSNVPQSMVDDYVRAYQDMERRDQEAAAAAQKAAKSTATPVPPGMDVTGSLPDSAAGASGYPGGAGDTNPTVTQTESASQFAQDYLRKNAGGQVGATQIAHVFDMFLNSLGGIGAGSTQGSPT